MAQVSEIQEHMPVKGADNVHVGTVDHVEGNRIKLTRSDPTAGGKHHYIDMDMVAAVANGTVTLNRTGAQARDDWTSADTGADTMDDEHGAEPGSPNVGP